MKPTKRLILGLRETAQELRMHPERYNWWNPKKCNCGLLARKLGWEKAVGYGSWTYHHKQCCVTGQPLTELFAFLEQCGLERTDFREIEHMDGTANRANPTFVARWMDAKADELERRRTAAEKESERL